MGYVPTDEYPVSDAYRFFRSEGLTIHFNDIVAHSRSLAATASQLRRDLLPVGSDPDPYPPLRTLLESLQQAQQFVHFTTYGLSQMLLGAIKLIAQRVCVKGIVSNADPSIIEEVGKYADEAPYLSVHAFERDTNPESWETVPHQKIIVVDGLLAFKGSANMTTNGWRKAAQGLDHIEVVTDVKEVTDLHNRLFSPVWAKGSAYKDVRQLTMKTVPW